MRLPSLLAALVLAAPLFAGCDATQPDAPAAVRAAAPTATADARPDPRGRCPAAVLGPFELAPGATGGYALEVECGPVLAVQWTVYGDADIIATGFDTVTLRARDVPGGSFTVRADFTYEGETGGINTDSFFFTGSIEDDEPPQGPVTIGSDIDATRSDGILFEWKNTVVSSASCALTIVHQSLVEPDVIDQRTVPVACFSPKTYLDTWHVGEPNPDGEIISYRFRALDASGTLVARADQFAEGRER